jgi:cyclophilin family peptidyl-prolyl cis-trans isomerase
MLFRRLVLPLLFLTSLNCALAGTLVQFRTVFGDIELELYDNDKPVTVQNFLNYLRSGRYQNGVSHRLVPNFVIQGGGFVVTNLGSSSAIVPIPTDPPITNEFGVGRRFSNVFGTIAMAKVGTDTNSATSEWYINLSNNVGLDAANANNLFVVFGHVIAGTNVLNVFNSFQTYNGTQQSNLVADVSGYNPAFSNFPLTAPFFTPTNVVYVDVSLMQITIQPATGSGQEISWNSATGLTNIVEFTTSFPPVWTTLAVTNGSGARMSVVDGSADPNRFYRVRVIF